MICPECQSDNVMPIQYGLPIPEAVQEAKEGKIVLGGCCVSEESPNWFCKSCGISFKDKT